MLKRFLGLNKVRVGLAIMLLFVLMATLGTYISSQVLGYQPSTVDTTAIGGQPPNANHWLGATQTGQDVFTWLMHGAKNSLLVGVVSAFLGAFLSVAIGTWAGFSGGRVDTVLNVFMQVFHNIPTFAVLLMIAAVMQNTSWILVAVIIAMFEWPDASRKIRAQTMSLRGRDFTAALRTVGERKYRIILFEVMPHLMGVISPMFLSLIAAGISMQAALAFIGIGDATEPSWGIMINFASNGNALFRNMWWWFAPPGICLALIGFATTMINFGLDEITNPSLSTKRQRLMRVFFKQQKQERIAQQAKADVQS